MSSSKRKRQESDDSDSESDSDWDNLVIDAASSGILISADEDTAGTDVVVELGTSSRSPGRAPTRHANTALARKIRLDIHRTHLLCLLAHNATRNAWCRHEAIRAALKPCLDAFTGNLHPKTTSSQYQRTRVLTEGLAAAVQFWSKQFKVVGSGLSRPKWLPDEALPSTEIIGGSFNFRDFVKAAKEMRGSRDIAAQLFAAFLHCQGLAIRLTCSLQVLGYVLGKGNTISATDYFAQTPSSSPAKIPSHSQNSTPTKSKGSVARRFTRPTLGKLPVRQSEPVSVPSTSVSDQSEPSYASRFPIYWAEVFDEAAQKWIPVDAVCTKTVGKSSKLEPPASDQANLLSYAIGYEADGTACDVTQRYATLYNAKTLKHRVDAREQGSQWWWARVLPLYQLPKRHPGRAAKRDREAIETAFFQAQQVKEPIPTNVQDFKRHPLFVLERDLRRDEVLEEGARECGSIVISKARPPIMERVFPRKAVITVRTAQQWYLRARVVRPEELPRKFRTASSFQRQARKRRLHHDEDAEADLDPSVTDDVPMFSEDQTDAYLPPPVIIDEDGHSLVPKNQFGNVDLYCAAMLPPDALHLSCSMFRVLARHDKPDHVVLSWPETQISRYLLELTIDIVGIDAAPAITGFKHTRAAGASAAATPVIDGVIFAEVYREAMEVAVVAALDYIQELADSAKSVQVVQRWLNWLQRLRVQHHVETRYGDIELESAGQGGFMVEEEKTSTPATPEAVPGDQSDAYSFEYESD